MLILFTELFHQQVFDGFPVGPLCFFLFDQFIGAKQGRRADFRAEEADALIPGNEFEDVIEGPGIDAVDLGFDQFPHGLAMAAGADGIS